MVFLARDVNVPFRHGESLESAQVEFFRERTKKERYVGFSSCGVFRTKRVAQPPYVTGVTATPEAHFQRHYRKRKHIFIYDENVYISSRVSTRVATSY